MLNKFEIWLLGNSSRFFKNPKLKLSTPVTSFPSFTSFIERLDPIKPAAPVIKILFAMDFILYHNSLYCKRYACIFNRGSK